MGTHTNPTPRVYGGQRTGLPRLHTAAHWVLVWGMHQCPPLAKREGADVTYFSSRTSGALAVDPRRYWGQQRLAVI